MPEIPELTDEVKTGETVHCRFTPDVDPPAPVETKPSLTIQFPNNDPDSDFEERSISIDPAGNPTSTNIALDLGETMEDQLIILQPIPYQQQEFKIEQQFETSMALGDEGPHYDLDRWKHYTSPWQEIPATGRNRFVTPSPAEKDLSRFPKITTREIISFLKKDGASKRWIELARTCKDSNSGACYTTASRISLRISTKEGGRWKLIHTINFSVPMGC
jgi:hypothetical protein